MICTSLISAMSSSQCGCVRRHHCGWAVTSMFLSSKKLGYGSVQTTCCPLTDLRPCWEQQFSEDMLRQSRRRPLSSTFSFFHCMCSSQAKQSGGGHTRIKHQTQGTDRELYKSGRTEAALYVIFISLMWLKRGTCYFRMLWELWTPVAA